MYKKVVRFEDILSTVSEDYPELRLVMGKKFMFRPPRTVVYMERIARVGNTDEQMGLLRSGQACAPGGRAGGGGESVEAEPSEEQEGAEQLYDVLQLLHEVGHALLGHRDFRTDVERVKMERAAWEKARELCQKYGVEYDEEFVEAELDTYRDWLHQRSRCKVCGLTRYQDKGGVYHCPFCELL